MSHSPTLRNCHNAPVVILDVKIVTLLPVPLVATLPAVRPSRALFALFLVEAGRLAQV
jgi:hypothetical protein